MNCFRGRALRVAAATLLAGVVCSAALTFAAPPRRLTKDGRLKLSPVMVDGGRQVVYTLEEKFNRRSIVRLTLADGSVERLHPGITQSEFGATFAADGQRYAYLHNNGNLHINLLIRDVKTGNTAKFDAGGGFAGVRSPSLAPDGSRVVFALPEKGFKQQLFSVDASAANRIALTDDEGFNACPRYSPNGRQIAFASTREGNFDIYVMSSQGVSPVRLTRHRNMDTHPAWSPDGKRIAFTSLRDGNYEVYVIGADGSGLRRITDNDERDDYATWHPDGKKLVTVSERQGRFDLYMIDVAD